MKTNESSKQFWIKKFNEFLRDNGVAAKYYNNVRLCNDNCPFNEKSRDSVDKRLSEIYDEFGHTHFIQWGFEWDKTTEGWYLWSDLDTFWGHVLYNS